MISQNLGTVPDIWSALSAVRHNPHYRVIHQVREELLLIKNYELRFSISTLCYNAAHTVQSGAARHSQGFEDKNLGSSPGLLGQ